jgi:predicted PurR-regulated permease PerM
MSASAAPEPAIHRAHSGDYERYAVFAAILLLVIGCYLVIRPFLIAFIWGLIISISTRGLYRRCLRLVGGRARLAAALSALFLVAVLLVPIAALALNLADGIPKLTAWFDGIMAGGIKEPPSWLEGLPLVGRGAAEKWRAFAADPSLLREQLKPVLGPMKTFLVAAVGGIGAGILQFALALVVTGLLYVRGEKLAPAVDRVTYRLGGDFGRRQIAVVRSTVRGVFNGMLGTCAVQALLAMIGFWIAGVPSVFLLGVGTFFLSVVPGGPALLWGPAALWLSSNGSTGRAIFLAIWGLVIVGGSDNVVRPLLIGKGIAAPLALVFLGVIGGVFAFGFLGLFIGPVLLVVAYNLIDEWLEGGNVEVARAGPSVQP